MNIAPKRQKETLPNMIYIEITFDPNQIRNVPLEKYEKDFTLFLNDHPYKMSRIVADLLSPEISRLHLVDKTIIEYSISTSVSVIDEELYNKKGDKSNNGTASKKLKSSKKIEEQKIMKEIIDTIERGNIMRIEKAKEQEQGQKSLKRKEDVQLNLRKRAFVCEIMRKLGREDYLKFLPEFSGKITEDNVFDRIKTKFQFEMNIKRDGNDNNSESESEKENEIDQIKEKNILIMKELMKEEIEFIAKHFFKMIKEQSKSRKNMKSLEVEIIEKIIENENLQLENEESLLKFINELYEKDRKYSILYEYVEFSNILETSIKTETNNNDSINNTNFSDYSSDINDSSDSSDGKVSNPNPNNNGKITILDKIKDKNDSKEEMRKFFEIFDINDLSFRIWNQIFCKFDFMNNPSKGKRERKGARNENNNNIDKRYHNEQKSNIIEIDEALDLNGIMRYLTNETKGNIHENGTINITTNSIYQNDSYRCHPKYLVDFDETKYYESKDEENVYICFDFKDKQIEISKYQIKSYDNGANGYHLKNWKLEISNDGKKWEEIDRRENCRTLNGSRIIGTFKTRKERKFARFVRLVQTGKSWYNEYYVLLYNIEFYGKMKDTKK